MDERSITRSESGEESKRRTASLREGSAVAGGDAFDSDALGEDHEHDGGGGGDAQGNKGLTMMEGCEGRLG